MDLSSVLQNALGRGPKPGPSLRMAWERLEGGTHLKLLGMPWATPRNPRQQLENCHTMDAYLKKQSVIFLYTSSSSSESTMEEKIAFTVQNKGGHPGINSKKCAKSVWMIFSLWELEDTKNFLDKIKVTKDPDSLQSRPRGHPSEPRCGSGSSWLLAETYEHTHVCLLGPAYSRYFCKWNHTVFFVSGWLLSLNITFSGLIHVLAWVNTSFLFVAE